MKEFIYDIITAGHICLDISPAFEGLRAEGINDIFVPGKLVNIEGVTFSAGGSVANTGFAIKKMGLRVKPVANIGNDFFGRALNEVVSDECGEAIDLNENISTSYSIILSVPGIDRIILHDPAGNNTFTSKNINFNEVGKAKLFHFGYPPLMRNVYKNNGEELAAIFKKAKKMGVVTSLDMSLPDADSESGTVDWGLILPRVLPFVDVFLPSVEEALFMLDRPEYIRVKKEAKSSDFAEKVDLEILLQLGQKIINMGAKIAVIKCGSKGMYVKSANEERLRDIRNVKLAEGWANKELFEETYKVHDFKSALAAGDTTIAGFLASMLSGFDLYNSLKIACKTGGLCCESYDSISGLLPLDEIIKKIETEKEKNSLNVPPESFKYNQEKSVWEIIRRG